MSEPVIKVTNPYGIPQDIRDSARAQGEDNPLDIRKDGAMGMLLKVLGLPGIATGMRVPRAKSPPMLPSQPGVMPELRGMDNFNKIRPGHKGLDFPGHDNAPWTMMPADVLKQKPGVRPAKEPFGTPPPYDKVTEYLMGKNEGKGNFGTTDAMTMRLPANDTPEMNFQMTGKEKFELALQDQQLQKMGLTKEQIANLSPIERLEKLFPDLFKFTDF